MRSKDPSESKGCSAKSQRTSILQLEALAWKRYDQGDIDGAIASARKVVEMDPASGQMRFLLGVVFGRRGNFRQAEEEIRAAISIRNDVAEWHSGLGITLALQHRYLDAEVSFQRALDLAPDFQGASANLANVLLLEGKAAEAASRYRRILAQDGNDPLAGDNLLLCLNYLSGPDREAIWQEHRHIGRRFDRPTPVIVLDLNPEKRLRVGYVSGDFRSHPVGYFTEAILASHDASAIETVCFVTDPRSDEMTRRFRDIADHWVEAYRMTDDALAKEIRRLKIDVLVDLSGHTEGNRLSVFGTTPAPVQMSYLGYANTTGMSTISVRIADWYTEPSGAEVYSSERIVRTPGSYFCFSPPLGASEPSPSPSLKNGVVTFGSFCHLAKVTEKTIELWSEVLAAIPGARLILGSPGLADPAARSRTQEAFLRYGIDTGRLDLRGPIPYLAHLQRYSEVDIALDTFPFNLATNTCEALWMGVPVVSLTGDRHVSRLGLSLLSAAGFNDLACQTSAEFVDCCRRLTETDLSAFRQTVRGRLKESALLDGRRVSLSLETAYRDAWRDYCAQSGRQSS